jgi:hypothetical protein
VSFAGSSKKKEECRKLPQPAVSGLRREAFASKWDTGRMSASLRYRSTTIAPQYYYRSTTPVGRSGRRCPQNRLRFPCRSQPARCRGAPAKDHAPSGAPALALYPSPASRRPKQLSL